MADIRELSPSRKAFPSGSMSGMLSEYFQAILSDWVALVSGIASLIFTLAGTFSSVFTGMKGIHAAKTFFWIAAAVCFFVANFRLWADERAQRKKLEAELSGRCPKLILGLSYTIWIYDELVDKTLFFIAANIVNQGEPSVAISWGAEYKIGDSVEPMETFHLNDSGYVVVLGNERLTIRNNDLLNIRTLETPIPRGGHVLGRVFFTIPGNRTEQVKSLQYKIHVHCMDCFGATSETVYTPDPKPSGKLFYHPYEKVEILTSHKSDSSTTPQLQ